MDKDTLYFSIALFSRGRKQVNTQNSPLSLYSMNLKSSFIINFDI